MSEMLFSVVSLFFLLLALGSMTRDFFYIVSRFDTSAERSTDRLESRGWTDAKAPFSIYLKKVVSLLFYLFDWTLLLDLYGEFKRSRYVSLGFINYQMSYLFQNDKNVMFILLFVGLIFPPNLGTFLHRCWVHRVGEIPVHPHGTTHCILK